MTRLAATVYNADLVDAWKDACDRIANAKSVNYVLVTSFGNAWNGTNEQRQCLDKAAYAVNADTPSSVASMLLPKAVRISPQTAAEAIEVGQNLMGRGRRKGLSYSGWQHTYFERLTGAWINRKGQKETISQNRLLKAIEKINDWGRNAEAVFYIHTNVETDPFRPLGSPCLQYIQLRVYGDGCLSIVGLYRAHDYVHKALGNFIGLNDLGRFVANNTGRTFTGADVVSLRPFIKKKSQANEYLGTV
jgi:hypothetical protein